MRVCARVWQVAADAKAAAAEAKAAAAESKAATSTAAAGAADARAAAAGAATAEANRVKVWCKCAKSHILSFFIRGVLCAYRGERSSARGRAGFVRFRADNARRFTRRNTGFDQ